VMDLPINPPADRSRGDAIDGPLPLGVDAQHHAVLFSSIFGHAAALSSLSAPRMTILSAPSGSGRCNAFASSYGARISDVPFFIGRQDHRHRLRVWIVSTTVQHVSPVKNP
jgi:hypothetical protein